MNSIMAETIIGRGAEAILIQQGNHLIKRRIAKGYRIKEIDEKLRKSRTKAEAKIMQKLENKISIPKILKVNEKSKEIEMEFIEGKRLADFLDSFSLEKQEKICKEIGKETGKIHNEDLIHGDLTTSNMILVEDNKKCHANKQNTTLQSCAPCNKELSNNNMSNFKVFFIDFGLGFHSERAEDKAVDLHLLKQALEAKHFQNWEKLFSSVIKGYSPKDKDKILKQLEKVELRGRYKEH